MISPPSIWEFHFRTNMCIYVSLCLYPLHIYTDQETLCSAFNQPHFPPSCAAAKDPLYPPHASHPVSNYWLEAVHALLCASRTIRRAQQATCRTNLIDFVHLNSTNPQPSTCSRHHGLPSLVGHLQETPLTSTRTRQPMGSSNASPFGALPSPSSCLTFPPAFGGMVFRYPTGTGKKTQETSTPRARRGS
jgi:hypothetical protein